MNIIIKDIEGKQRIQRLIEYLDLNFYDWSEQQNDGKPLVSGSAFFCDTPDGVRCASQCDWCCSGKHFSKKHLH